jgi:signal transduction histidine kinase
MVVKDRVTGVIELLNKRGTDNFTEEDQALLSAFATNAAVAVENARLFTLTDQALASRLEELSTLQEIDRQLNTSLDIKHVLELTLDWGLRVTDARAGSVGMVDREQNVIIVMATRNYTYQPITMPIEQGLAGHVVRTGQPILVNDVSQESRYVASTPLTKSQLSVPIRRENAVIGVITLESPQLNGFGILQLDTATRLADHAATAITNAKLYEEVKRANDAKSEFVSIVSHELKTPMTSMKGYTDLLVKGMAGPLNDMQAQFLNTIRANVERMSTLVNDLLEVSRIETGRLKMEIRPLEIDALIDETLRTTHAQIEERAQTLELNVPTGLPMIMGDKARFIQVLTNLISNAYKYTPNGGRISIAVTRSRQIQPPNTHPPRPPTGGRPEPQNPAGYLVCAVTDSGVGIAPEDKAKLFTKFFRSGDPLVREQPGTGLGLSITRSLIELQQGAIWVESEVGVGSTFAFSVPIAENHEEAATE